MKHPKLFIFLFLITIQQFYAQEKTDNKKDIYAIINQYSKSVIKRDSLVFYDLFNEGTVIW